MIDRTFKALADPNRRRILAMLREGDLPAGEIADQFEMAFASVSHHLQVLRDAGLVISRRDGQHIIYSLQHLLELGASTSNGKGKGKRHA